MVHVDPQLYDHVEAMVAAAVARDGSVDAVALGEHLGKPPDQAVSVLAGLAAGGLLQPIDWAGERPFTYRLARAPAAIGLHEVARVAGYPHAHGSQASPDTDAGLGAQSVSIALNNRTRDMLDRLTLADILPSLAGDALGAAPGTTAGSPIQGADFGSRADNGSPLTPISPAPTRFGITAADLWRLVHAGTVPLVIDVRATPDSSCPAPAWAHWLALEDLADHAIAGSADVRIVTVCEVGIRSLVAASYLRCNGYGRAYYLIGGLEAWNRRWA